MCALLGVCESVWPRGPLITSPLQSQGGFTDTTGRLWKPHSKVVRCSNTSTTICTSPLMSAPSHSSISGGSGNAGEETSNDINYLSHSWSWIIWGLFLFSRRCYLQRKRLHWERERDVIQGSCTAAEKRWVAYVKKTTTNVQMSFHLRNAGKKKKKRTLCWWALLNQFNQA